MIQCPNCKQTVPQGTMVCPHCGYHLKPTQVMTDSRRAQVVSSHRNLLQTKWGKILLGVIAIIIVLLGIVASAVHNNHALGNIVPGHVYYDTNSDNYLAFGEGKVGSRIVIVKSGRTAQESVESVGNFTQAYNQMIDENVNNGVVGKFYQYSNQKITVIQEREVEDSNGSTETVKDTAIIKNVKVKGLKQHKITGHLYTNDHYNGTITLREVE